MKLDLLNTDTAAATLGISAVQFRRIVTMRGYQPDDTFTWHHGRGSGIGHLWSHRTLAKIRRTKVYHAASQRAAKAQERKAAVRAKLEQLRIEGERIAAEILATVDALALDELVTLARDCMHAANRRAKYLGKYGNREIYSAKDGFLDAMVRTGRATVGSFVVRQESREQYCGGCGRSWVGDGYCYECDDVTGGGALVDRRWWIVDCGNGYRFHRPVVAPDIASKAVDVEPHDPTQVRREIPEVKLGALVVPAHLQLRIVALATAKLAEEGTPPVCAATEEFLPTQAVGASPLDDAAARDDGPDCGRRGEKGRFSLCATGEA